MSTILVNTLTGTSTAGSIVVTGEGNSTTTNLQQGLAKSWVTFDMASTTPDDSFNNSSLTDSGTGDFIINLSSAHATVNYPASGYTNAYDGDSWAGGMSLALKTSPLDADSYVFKSYNGSSLVDAKHNYSVTHGDLA
tara:strand:- start:321 stop:731 length:411 start_codon:yes stop_codon:yes gene_type:complete